MSEITKCPSCEMDLREDAKFCDKCGKPLAQEADGAAPAAPVPATAPKVNWAGVTIVLVLVGLIAWLLFVPKDKGGAGAGMGGDPANPHGAGMDGGGAASPHGEQAGMEGLTATLAAAKAKLDEDPLDRDALMTLYQNYGMIGMQAKIRPYLDKAIAALEAQSGELGDKLVETGMNIGLAALLGNELDGALAVYQKLNELRPGTPEVVVMLGDVCAAQDKYAEAIKYYDEFLGAASEAQGDQYWGAVLNRAVAMRMQFEQAAPGQAQQAWLTESIAALEKVTGAKPGMFGPQYNLALAYGAAGQKDKARAALDKARPLAKDAMEQWQVDAEIAKLEGKEPPPQPAADSMELGGMGSAEGMPNPHGGGMGSAEGMPNPHGGEAANPHGGMDGGAGMANPHGGA